MNDKPVVFCRKVTKYYPAHLTIKSLLKFQFKRALTLILREIDFKVFSGEIFGIVGPNGAGKTTILKIMCHLTPPTSGSVSVSGYDTEKEWESVVHRIGYCISEERSFFWRLTGRQNLEFFSDLMEVPVDIARKRIEDLLEFLEIKDAANDRFMNYSSGMKQRMAVARSLLANPDVLFMDEPTRGLDPRGASRLRSFIKDYVGTNGKTAIITTNLVSDIENLCDRIAILNRGRIIAMGSIPEIRASLEQKYHIEEEMSFETMFNHLLEADRKEQE